MFVALTLLLATVVSAYGYGYHDDYSTYSKRVVKTPWIRTVEIQRDTPYGTSYYYSSKDYRYENRYHNQAYDYWMGYNYPERDYWSLYYQPERYQKYDYFNRYNYPGWRY